MSKQSFEDLGVDLVLAKVKYDIAVQKLISLGRAALQVAEPHREIDEDAHRLFETLESMDFTNEIADAIYAYEPVLED